MIGGKHYDAVILGAGLGGLLAAALLGRRGRHVLVLEENDAPGGLSRPVGRNGYRFDDGPSLFLGFERNGFYDKIFMELGLSLTSIKREARLIRRLSPPLQLVLADHRLDFFLDPENFIDELVREFPGNRAAIQLLNRCIDAKFPEISSLVMTERRHPQDWKSRLWQSREVFLDWMKRRRLRGKSADRFLESLGIDPELRRGLRRVAAVFTGMEMERCSEFDLLLLLGFMRQEVVEISGGASRLGEQLVGLIQKFKGDVLFSQRVEEIVVHRRQVREIRLPRQRLGISGCCIAHVPVSRLPFRSSEKSPAVFHFGIRADRVPGPMRHHLILDPESSDPSSSGRWLFITLSDAQDLSSAPADFRALRVVVFPGSGQAGTEQQRNELRKWVEKKLSDLMPFSDDAITHLGDGGPGTGTGERLSAVGESLTARARKRGWPDWGYCTSPVRNFYLLPDGGDHSGSHLWEVRAAADLANRITGR